MGGISSAGMSSGLGGFLFGNIDEEGKLDNEDFDEELRANLTTFSEKIQDRKILLESGFLADEIIGEISVNGKVSSSSAATVYSSVAPVKPLPDAENFEDINELAEQVVSSALAIEDSSNSYSGQPGLIEPLTLPRRLDDENNQTPDDQFAPFDERQILKFTQLSARPVLLNATGRSYSRYAALRKIKLKRKQLHSKSTAFSSAEDQLETFLTKTSPSIGGASAAAARLKLSLINISSAGPTLSGPAASGPKGARKPWHQSRRFKDLESTLDKIKLDLSGSSNHNVSDQNFDEEAAKRISIPENSNFHPLSLIEWENQVIWDIADVSSNSNSSNIQNIGSFKGMYVNLNASINPSASSSTGSNQSTAAMSQSNPSKSPPGTTSTAAGASLSSILSSLSLSNGALSGDSAAASSATATALLALIRNQQMRSASLSHGSLLSQASSFSQSLPSTSSASLKPTIKSSVPAVPAVKLRYPKAPAARVLNREFESGDWTDSVIWDPSEFNPLSARTHLILPLDDPELVFTPIPVENLSKKLGRAEKLIAKRLKKLQNTAAGITSFSKPIPDKFNISNDKYYETSGVENDSNPSSGGNVSNSSTSGPGLAASKSSKLDHSASISARSTVSAAFLGLHASVPALQHSVPTLKLAPPSFQTCRTKRELRLWHRPRLSIPPNSAITAWSKVSYSTNHNKLKSSTESGGTFNKPSSHQVIVHENGSNLRVGIAANPSGGGIIRSAKKLTLKDASRFVLLEYFEEFPPLLMNPGMGAYIVLYYRKKSPQDSFVPKSTFALVQVLDFTDPSPFMIFGDVPAGSIRYALCNGLFRAPLFPHKPASSDFLICRHAADSSAPTTATTPEFYLRPLESAPVLLVGQEFPLVEVPGPHSRRHNIFCRQRLQVAAYRLFNKDLPENTRKRLKIGRLLTAFPQFSEGSIRKWLKDYAESTRAGKDSGVWLLKEDAPQLDEDELRALVTPEAICQYESMMAEQQRLLDAEFAFYDPFHASSDQQPEVIDDEGNPVAAHEQKASAAISKSRRIAELTSAAPWNTTANFINAAQGRCTLKLRGLGDPSGRGEAFSFVKAPGEKGTSTSVINAAGSEYRQEISRIWETHVNSLASNGATSSTGQIVSADVSTDLDGTKLIISRRFGPDKWISEEITDPLVIRAYLRVRHSSSNSSGGPGEKSFRRTFVAPESLPKLSATDAAPLTSAGTNKTGSGSSKSGTGSNIMAKSKASAQKKPSPEKNLQIKCGACGQIGHMRTNRICPMFSDDPSVNANAGASGATNAQNTTAPALKLKLKLSNDSNSVGGDNQNINSKNSASLSNSTISSNESIYPSPVLLPVSHRPKGPPIEPLQSTRKRPRRKLTPKQLHAQFLAAQSVQVRAKLAELSTALISLVDSLLVLPTTPAFHKPVPRKLYPLYYKLISQPIDLGTIRTKAVSLSYKSSNEFVQDFLLLRDNCVKFNGPEAPLSDVARDMLERVQNGILSSDSINEIDALLVQNIIKISENQSSTESNVDHGDEVSILTDHEETNDDDDDEGKREDGDDDGQDQEEEKATEITDNNDHSHNSINTTEA